MSLRYKRPPGFGVNGGGDGATGGIWIWDRGRPAPRPSAAADSYRAARPDRRRARPGDASPRSGRRLPLSVPAPVLGDRRRPLLRYVNCAGGGWGDPLERDPEAVKRDVRDGYVTIAGAARDYGVASSAIPTSTPRGSCSTRRDRRAARVDAGRRPVSARRRGGADRARDRAAAHCSSSGLPETERRTYYSEEIHREFDAAGFYRMLVPRRYGGLEVDLTTFLRVMVEIAAGDLSSAWCLCLASAHALHLATLFGERAQEELFGDGDFRSPAVAAPAGQAVRTADGWEISGTWAYCSGAPYATHYMGQTFEAPAEPGGRRPDPAVRRAAQRMGDAARLGRLAGAARQRRRAASASSERACRPITCSEPVAHRHRHARLPGWRCTATPSMAAAR